MGKPGCSATLRDQELQEAEAKGAGTQAGTGGGEGQPPKVTSLALASVPAPGPPTRPTYLPSLGVSKHHRLTTADSQSLLSPAFSVSGW